MIRLFTKKKMIAAGALLFLALLYVILLGRGRESGVNPDIYIVTKGDVAEEIQLSGTIQPLVKEDVASAVNARIKKTLVKEGDLVKKGQLLIEMNEEDLISKLESARSKLLRAKVKYDEVRNWESSATYINAKTQLENAQTDYEDKERTYKQNQELYRAKAISQQDLIRSKLDLDRARAALAGAQATLEEAKIRGDKDALSQVKSDYIIASIDFRDAQEALSHKEIVAPYSGVVVLKQQTTTPLGTVEKSVSENRVVTPGEILLSIADRDSFTVDAPLDEFDVYKIHLNQPGVVSVPALGGKKFASKIVDISSSKSGKGAFFQIRNLIENPDPQIKVGLTANVEIPLKERKGVLVVPVSALVKRGEGYGVYLKQDDEAPKYQLVKIGLANSEVAEITQGLTAGQKILRRVPSRLTGEG